MTRKVDTRMAPWIGPLEARREQARRAKTELDPLPPREKSEPSQILAMVGVPEALLESHGARLADSASDLAAIVYAGRALPSHRKRQLELAVKQLYAVLHRALDLDPDPNASQRIISGLRELADAGGPQLVPALYAAIGLLDLSVRRAGAALPEPAIEVVRSICERMQGRAGASSLLSVLPNIAERIDLAADPVDRSPARRASGVGVSAGSPNPIDRPASWRAIAQRLLDATPLAGADAELAAALAEQIVGGAIAGSPRAEALLPTLVGTPMREALAEVVKASPLGPERLFVSMERLLALGEREDLAPRIASLASSPVAAELLDALADGIDLALLDDPRFEVLPPPLRSVAAAAVIRDPTPERVAAVIARAQELRTDAPYFELKAFADRHAAAAQYTPELALAIAESTHDALVPQYQALAGALAQIGEALPKAPLEEVVAPLAELVDPEQRFNNPPLELLTKLLDAIRPAGNRRHDGDLARLAIAMAAGLARIGSDPSRHLARAVQDLLPAIQSLRSAGSSAIAVRSDPLSLLLGSPLPAEVRATAARHLTPPQLDWAGALIEKNRRELNLELDLRDFIFGCVEAGRTDVIEAARTSPSPRRAIRSAMREIAQAFRTATLPTVLFDPIAVGLRAGRAPILDIQRAKDAGQLSVDLMALTGGHATEEGRAQVMASAERVNWLLSICVEGGPTYDPDIDMGSLRPVLLACISAAASGQWPAFRYESAVGQRLMSKLAGDQRALWRASLVTSAEAPPPVNDPALARANALVRGMAAAMPELIELGDEGLPPLGWDDASIENLHAVRDDAIAGLRANPKGTDEHREAVRILHAAQDNLALLELYRALEQTAALDPAQAMLRLRPSLEAAMGVLRSRGGEGFSEAMEEVLASTEHLSTQSRSGSYAIDEDGFGAMIESHVSGCLSPNFNGPGRQYGLVGGLADANIRMLRVMDGDQQRYRGYLKFFDVQLSDHRGPALWLDLPIADGEGSDTHKELWYRHAVAKAKLMGLPLIIGPGDTAGDLLAKLGAEAGLEVRRDHAVTFAIDDGNTGYMHSDTMFPGKGNIRESRGEAPAWTFAHACPAVVMPPRRS